MERIGTRGVGLGVGLAMLAAAALQLWAYAPGVMVWDSVHQYARALSGLYDDWHPPAFEWVWRRLIPIHSGPAPMILLQTALYWGGFALLSGWALKQSRRGLTVSIAACGLLPIGYALTQIVLKDSLFAGLLLSAAGLLAWRQAGARADLAVLAAAMLIAASTLRFNALPATLPLLVALGPAWWRQTPGRMVLVTVIAAIPLVLAMPAANALLNARRSGVELSLQIFDLGGITYFSGVDAFPPLPVVDPVTVNSACYTPVSWDRYAWWVEDPCEISFDLIRASEATHHLDPTGFWLKAIAAHPVAYAEHRLAHFNRNIRFLIAADTIPPAFDQTDPNPWGFHLSPNPVRAVIQRTVLAVNKTPIGWPATWLALAAGVLLLSPRLPSRPLLVPLALSSLLYGFGYLAVSVASEMRYHLWTIVAALVATVIAAGDVRAGAPVSMRRLATALVPAVAVTVLGTIWRMA